MAINPATVKLLLKLALQAVTDEEARKKYALVVLALMISVLLIIASSIYILTSPLSFLTNLFTNDSNKTAIKQYKSQYEDKVKLQTGNLILNGRYPMPAAGEITSPYGMRLHPIKKQYIMHTGIDLGTVWHCPIISIADGQVAKTGIDKGYGIYIIIKHQLPEETFYSVYAHLSQINALPDQEVAEGDIIGLEGGDPEKDMFPGVSTAHHLHFEIRSSMNPSTHVDPLPYLFNIEKETGAKPE